MGQIQSVSDILRLLRRRLFLIALVVTLGAVCSVYYALSRPRAYEATAVIQIETPQVSGAVSSGGAATIAPGHRLRLLEQQLMARDNLLKVIVEYDLFADAPSLSMNQKVVLLRQSARLTPITDQAQAWRPDAVPTGMMVTVRLGDPLIAADVANEFLALAIEQSRLRRSQSANETTAFFEGEAARVEAEIAALGTQIASFKETNADLLPAGILAQRDEVGSLKTTLLELEQKLIELEANSNRQRAEVLELQSGLLRQQQRLITERIKAIEQNIQAAPEVERQLGTLTRAQEQLREEYTIITRRLTEAEMGQVLENQQQLERFVVLETALPPEFPVSSSRKKIVAMGVFMSAVVGVGLAFLLEILNPAIRTRAQLEQALGVQPVIAIPRLERPGSARWRRILWIGSLASLLAAVMVFLGSGLQRISGSAIPVRRPVPQRVRANQ